MLQLAFLAAICYAIADWRYVRKGGKRTAKREKGIWAASIGGFVLLVALLVLLLEGLPTSRNLSDFAALELNWIFMGLLLGFIFFECRRQRIRKANPLL